MEHEICRCQIIGYRNVVDYCNPEKSFYIRVMRLRLQRIPQKNHEINLAFHNLCPDLLVAS